MAMRIGEHEMLTSKNATLECGSLSAGDMVYLTDGSIGEVVCFWELNGEFFSQLNVHRHINELFFDVDHELEFRHAHAIVEGVYWYMNATKNYIVAVVPEYA